MNRYFVLAYGLISYGIFLATFLYAVGFVGNFVVPKSIDGTPTQPFWYAGLVNAALLGVFALQHSVMARQGFKRWWTKFVPHAMERSTYVLATCLALGLLFWQWQPMGGTIWELESTWSRALMYTGCAFGWGLVLASTFWINHFDLFGVRQVWLYFQGRKYSPLKFQTPMMYKYVRHPLYVGWFFAFWCTPVMTAAHLVFALMTTAYILTAIQFEERDLVSFHGHAYENYRKEVPMLIPFTKRSKNRNGTLEQEG